MCYSKALKADKYSIEKFYDATMRDIEYAPKFFETGFDFEEDPILTVERPKEILMYRWGLIPWFEKDPVKIKAPTGTLNCKSENMFTTASFRDVAEKGKRCLIPATSFLESHWSSVTKKTPKNKIPFKIYAKDQEIFSIAGLYSYWKDRESGREILSYTVLTTAANEMMKYIHNNPANPHRMPVIIKKEYEPDWLNPNLSNEDVLALCKSMPDDFLISHPITKEVNGRKLTSAEKNHPDIDKLVEYSSDDLDEVDLLKRPKATEPKKSKPDQGQQSLF
jgi:putative SOS response-associated peptidase YedK